MSELDMACARLGQVINLPGSLERFQETHAIEHEGWRQAYVKRNKSNTRLCFTERHKSSSCVLVTLVCTNNV